MTVLKLLARHTRTLRSRLSGLVGSDTSRHDEARYFYLGPDLALVRLKSGLGLYVDPQDRQISARVILRGHWEVWISMAVLSLLRPGDRVVEVGSNIGYYTLIMADRVGQQGQVVGLEANPRLATLANQSLGLNDFGGHAQVMNLAAMDVSGHELFVTSRANSGGGHTKVLAEAPFEDAVTISIPSIRLDDLKMDQVDFIRLDAEGCEPLILRGAASLLARNPDIIICMEWCPIQMGSRTSVEGFVAELVAQGFRFWSIHKDARLAPLTAEALVVSGHTDIIASRRDPHRR